MSTMGQRKAVSVGGPAKELIHKGCLGDIKLIQGLALLCVQCRSLVGINEVTEKPKNLETFIVD